jgi:hypothetical protein
MAGQKRPIKLLRRQAMRRYPLSVFAGLLACGLLVPGASNTASAANGKDGIEFVTYPQLGDLVKKNRGKVVVVDFWNIY